jgi:uncharacterized protein YraI
MHTRLHALFIALLALFIFVYVAEAQTVTLPAAGEVNATANLRSGPGITFPIMGRAAAGTAVEIVACNDDCSWYSFHLAIGSRPFW